MARRRRAEAQGEARDGVYVLVNCPHVLSVDVGDACSHGKCWAHWPGLRANCVVLHANKKRPDAQSVADLLGVPVDDVERELAEARARLAAWLRVCEVADDVATRAAPVSDEVAFELAQRLPLHAAVNNFDKAAASRVVSSCSREVRSLVVHTTRSL